MPTSPVVIRIQLLYLEDLGHTRCQPLLRGSQAPSGKERWEGRAFSCFVKEIAHTMLLTIESESEDVRPTWKCGEKPSKEKSPRGEPFCFTEQSKDQMGLF